MNGSDLDKSANYHEEPSTGEVKEWQGGPSMASIPYSRSTYQCILACGNEVHEVYVVALWTVDDNHKRRELVAWR